MARSAWRRAMPSDIRRSFEALEACVKAGAERDKLLQKVQRLKKTGEDFFSRCTSLWMSGITVCSKQTSSRKEPTSGNPSAMNSTVVDDLELLDPELRSYKKGRPHRGGGPDDFQTPPRALAPMISHLNRDWVIWEPCAGKGNLSNTLRRLGFTVIASDIAAYKGDEELARKNGIRVGPEYDFLRWQPENFDAIVTNPPYSLKNKIIYRCYQLGKPWALIMPPGALETKCRQDMFRVHGINLTFFGERISYETPLGGKSQAHFETLWYRWKLGPERNEFTSLPPFLDGLGSQALLEF